MMKKNVVLAFAACVLSFGCGPSKFKQNVFVPIPSKDNVEKVQLRAVVLPFEDQRPTTPDKNMLLVAMLVPFVPSSSITKERPESDPYFQYYANAEYSDFPTLVSYYMALDLNQYGPFSTTWFTKDLQEIEPECQPDVVITGSLKRSLFKTSVSHLGLGFIFTFVQAPLFQTLPTLRSGYTVEMDVKAHLRNNPRKIIWEKSFTHTEKYSHNVWGKLSMDASKTGVWFAGVFEQVREALANDLQTGGPLAKAAGPTTTYDLSQAEFDACLAPKNVLYAMKEWPPKQSAETSLGLSKGSSSGGSSASGGYQYVSNEVQKGPSLSSLKSLTKNWRIGVGPFRHLYQSQVKDEQENISVLTFGSGYDYSESVVKGLISSNLFSDVDFAVDSTDPKYDFVISGSIKNDPFTPTFGVWNWEVVIERDGDPVETFLIEHHEKQPKNKNRKVVLGKPPQKPSEIRALLKEIGSGVAKDLALKSQTFMEARK